MNSPGRQIEIRPALLAVVAALLLCSSVRAEELEAVTYTPAVKVVAPLSGEGFLWAPVLSPTPRNQIAFQFAYGYHGFDIVGEDIDASVYLMVLSGEYTFLGKLTLGAGVPFLVGYDVSTESDVLEDSDVDFGNIRLHVRYPVIEKPENGFILSFGPRYHFGDFYAELTFRFGLNDAEFYYGDFSLGVQLGYLLGY